MESRYGIMSQARARNLHRVQIVFDDGAGLRGFPSGFFDYASACMVLHEMENSQRLPLLRETQRLAQTLIFADYRIPQPSNLEA